MIKSNYFNPYENRFERLAWIWHQIIWVNPTDCSSFHFHWCKCSFRLLHFCYAKRKRFRSSLHHSIHRSVNYLYSSFSFHFAQKWATFQSWSRYTKDLSRRVSGNELSFRFRKYVEGFFITLLWFLFRF